MPFVFLSQNSSTEDRIKGYNMGADGYLTKPFDPLELVVLLDCLIERKVFLANNDENEEEDGGGGKKGEKDEEEEDGDDDQNDVQMIKTLKQELDEIKAILQHGTSNTTLELPPPPSSSSIIPSNYKYKYSYQEEDETNIFMTNDEMQVLILLCEGNMNKEIANELKYSTRWVEGILTKLYRKTNCANRTELVKWAVSLGYIEM